MQQISITSSAAVTGLPSQPEIPFEFRRPSATLTTDQGEYRASAFLRSSTHATPTARYEVSVYRVRDGKLYRHDNVLCKVRRTRAGVTTRINAAGAGSWTDMNDAIQGILGQTVKGWEGVSA